MGIVKERLLQPEKRPQIVTDCARLVDDEVAAKSGVTGLVVKGGYKAFKAIKPRIVENAVEVLLDEFVAVLDRHYETYAAADPGKRVPFDAWAKNRDAVIAEDLLKVTDDLMDRSNKAAIKKIYSSLRKIAHRNVTEAIPAVGRLVVRHVG